eukprot:COSAG04_NODE_18530_length_439_cov_0.829412_2_plen_37_part_01
MTGCCCSQAPFLLLRFFFFFSFFSFFSYLLPSWSCTT